jgi:nucleoid-associated protein YejK
VHSDAENTAGEHLCRARDRHFVEQVVGRKWGGDFFVDFVGSDTRLSCPRNGCMTDSADKVDYHDLGENSGVRGTRRSWDEETEQG